MGVKEHFWMKEDKKLIRMQPEISGKMSPFLHNDFLKYFSPQLLLLFFSCKVMSNSLWPHGLYPARLFCPWDFPGKNTGVGCDLLLQGSLPRNLFNPGIEPASPALAGFLPLRLFTTEPPGKPSALSDLLLFFIVLIVYISQIGICLSQAGESCLHC